MTVTDHSYYEANMEGLVAYGILICAGMVATGAVIGLVLIRKRSLRPSNNGLFGSVVKMPSPQTSIFPMTLYKQTDISQSYSSANDLSNMEGQPDAGLAGDRDALAGWSCDTDSSGSSAIGRGVQKWAVHFKMRYDKTIENLEVGLLRTSTIAVSNGDASSFLFFNVYLIPHEFEHRQSSLKSFNSTTTNFEETFFFRLRNVDAVSTILRLSLYTMDGGRTRTCIGHVAQPLCALDIFDGGVHYLTRDLTTLEAASMEGCLGETLVSLCYQMQKEKLKVRVLDARHLPAQSETDSRYYLQVDIIMGDRIAKTKRTGLRSSLRDVFNCSYAFVIPCRHMDVCAFVFSIMEVLENSGPYVRERPWGRFTIGPCSYAHGAGVDHWKMMLANSTKLIEMWHVIARAY